MRKGLIAVFSVLLIVVSCTGQSPEKYIAPEFGQLEVNLSGFKAIIQCEVIHAEECFEYGFILQENISSQVTEMPLSLTGSKIKTEIKGLDPSIDYTIQAFATNGINKVFSDKKHFKPSTSEQIVNIPDPSFKRLLLDAYDNNIDGQLSVAEAKSISNLSFYTDNIRSLEGIEAFSNLKSLSCCGSGDLENRTGKLTKLDLRSNNHLRSLVVNANNLEELLLPENESDIVEIFCVFNSLKSLDLSGCPKLKTLHCWENHLTSLDLSSNLFLTDLRCAQNDFSNGLDVSSNKELKYLYCNDDFLKFIDISENTQLLEFGCYDNLIKSIDVSHNINLKSFNCESNMITKLDLSLLHNLEVLSIGENAIIEPVDLSIFPNLILYGGNNLPLNKAPDFSNNANLTEIHISSTGGALYIDKTFFRNFPNMRTFNIGGYPGETIDLTFNTKIERIWIPGLPNMKVIDLSASPNLKYICLNGSAALEKVYVHKSVDISSLEIEKDSRVHASIEHKF